MKSTDTGSSSNATHSMMPTPVSLQDIYTASKGIKRPPEFGALEGQEKKIQLPPTEEVVDLESEEEEDVFPQTPVSVLKYPFHVVPFNSEKPAPAPPNRVLVYVPCIHGCTHYLTEVAPGGYQLGISFDWPAAMLDRPALLPEEQNMFAPNAAALALSIENVIKEKETNSIRSSIVVQLPYKCFHNTERVKATSILASNEGHMPSDPRQLYRSCPLDLVKLEIGYMFQSSWVLRLLLHVSHLVGLSLNLCDNLSI